MLRVTIQLLPDHSWNEPNFKPITMKIFDIKNDNSGGPFLANYRTRFYNHPKAAAFWRPKQILNVPYKESFPELLAYFALEPWIYDVYRGTSSYANRKDYTENVIDYGVWKATNRDKLIKAEERD